MRDGAVWAKEQAAAKLQGGGGRGAQAEPAGKGAGLTEGLIATAGEGSAGAGHEVGATAAGEPAGDSGGESDESDLVE